MTYIKKMDIQEFVDEGYLQEVNRRFFHPMGMALEVVTDATGKAVALGGVWDYRHDAEGLVYDETLIDPAKASRISQLERARRPDRLDRLGFWIQSAHEHDT